MLSAPGFQFNARIEYEAASTGFYYIQVCALDDTPGGNYIIHAEVLE